MVLGSPSLCLVRKHVLEYLEGLELPLANRLFDVEDAEHYAGSGCATFRFFRALARCAFPLIPSDSL